MNDFDDLSDLDEVFGPLRSSATQAELSQQEAVLEGMVKSRRTTEGKHMFTSRRARVATLVAAGVLGFGGMAAASPSLLGDQPAEPEPVVQPEPVVDDETIEPTDDVEPGPVEPIDLDPADDTDGALDEVEEVEPIAPAGAEQVAPTDAPLVNDPATVFDETTCLPGNHGATVSAVARGEFPDGVSVRDAAHSSCGKVPKVDDDAPETDIDPEVETEAEAEPAEERPRRDKGAASNANPSENSKGKSNGKGNGNSAPGKRGG